MPKLSFLILPPPYSNSGGISVIADPCSECAAKLKRLRDAALKRDDATAIVTRLIENHRHVSATLRDYVSTIRRRYREALDDLKRHEASHRVKLRHTMNPPNKPPIATH